MNVMRYRVQKTVYALSVYFEYFDCCGCFEWWIPYIQHETREPER